MPAIPEAAATLVLAFVVVVVVMPLLTRFALAAGFVDVPNARKIHSHPIPLVGGAAVYIGVILTLLLRGESDGRVGIIMLASFLVMALGVLDDRLDLHSRYRLLLQVGVAFGLTLCGVRFNFFPWEVLNHLVTIVWIVGVINAMNCIDCADGVAGVTTLVAFFTLGGLALENGRFFVFQVAVAGCGALLGFLVYNRPPARVFLGDTGSTFLGLMAAVLAVLANPAPQMNWTLPIAPFVLLVPVFDIIWVHVRRYRAGVRSMRDLLSSTGKDHLPHRLMAHGLVGGMCTLGMMLLSGLACGMVWSFSTGHLLPAGICAISLAAFLWHLEENSGVEIRPGDQVALYGVREDLKVPMSRPAPPALQHEESIA